jgi:hypothetical protein
LPVHVLTYQRGDQYKVYPDPGDDDTGFDVNDFVLDVTFVNPDAGSDGAWDYGVLFVSSSSEDEFRVYVTSDSRWVVSRGEDTLRESDAVDLNTDAEGDNTIRLIVDGGRGTLFINGRYAGSFELRGWDGAGRLWLSSTNLDGPDQAFLDLSIWSLE